MRICKKSFFGAAIGTMIEYYDYGLFSLLIPILAPIYCPGKDIYESISNSYYFLMIPLFLRPFGAIFFGYIGDRFGRRKALLTSITSIALATLIISITPTYARIGALAGLIIILAKSVQAFCFAGEYNGAGIYVVEHADKKNEAFIGSALTAITLLGSLGASLAGVIVTQNNMPDYAWRIAFAVGALIGLVSIFFRKNLQESPNFMPSTGAHSYKKLFREHKTELLASAFIGGYTTIPFTSVLIFINPVLAAKGFYTIHQLMQIQLFLVCLGITLLLLVGKLADRLSPASIIQFSGIFLVIMAYPICSLFDSNHVYLFIFAASLLIIFNELCFAPSNAYLKNLFIMQYRYRAISLSFNIGMCILGSLTPVVQNYLYQQTHLFAAISLWFVFIGLGTFLSVRAVEKKHVVLSGKCSLNVVTRRSPTGSWS